MGILSFFQSFFGQYSILFFCSLLTYFYCFLVYALIAWLGKDGDCRREYHESMCNEKFPLVCANIIFIIFNGFLMLSSDGVGGIVVHVLFSFFRSYRDRQKSISKCKTRYSLQR